MSEGARPALARALSEASRASETPVSPSDTQGRVLMPLRCTIHSSDVFMILARSSLVTTRAGTWKPVARNAVRGIGLRAVGSCARLRAAAKLPTLAHGSPRHQAAIRRHPQREASPRRLEEGPRRREERR